MKLEKGLVRASDVYFGRVSVSPTFALMLLDYNTENYRSLSNAHVNFLASAVARGAWIPLPCAPLVVRKDVKKGYVLLDGQHTLNGIVKTGKTVDMYLMVVPEEKGKRILPLINESTRARTFAQRLTYLGVPAGPVCAQVTRLLIVHKTYSGEQSRSAGRIGPDEQMQMYMRYEDGILFAARIAEKKGIGINAAYRTALARAFYNYPTARLEEFHEQFKTRECKNITTDVGAQLLANYFIQNHAKHHGGGELPTHQYYLRCEQAIHLFATSQSAKVLRPATHVGQHFTLTPPA